MSIPVELKQKRQWINYHSATDKRPIPSNYNDKTTHLTYDGAKHNKPEVGFIPYIDDEVVLIDIDKTKQLKDYVPDVLYKWIVHNKPYIEISPSGNGFRIVAKTDVSFKQHVKKAYKAAPDFKGQIGFHTNYQTITENQIREGYDNLPHLPPSLICQVFGLTNKEADVVDLSTQESTPAVDMLVGTGSQIEHAIMKIPLDQGDKIKSLYKQMYTAEYDHYYHWLYIGMAMYSWGERTNSLEFAFILYDRWSKSDPDPNMYPGAEELHNKWKSFATDRDESITYKTIYYLARHFELEWPIPMKTDTKAPPRPAIKEYKNFFYLLGNFLNLKLTKDSMKPRDFYLSGNKELCESYLHVSKIGDLYGPIPQQTFNHATFKICQDHQYRQLTKNINDHNSTLWVDHSRKYTNMVKMWLDKEFDDLPEELQINGDQKSTFDDLLDCIEFQEHYAENNRLFRTILLKSFLGWLKFYYYNGPFTLNNMCPVLSGPENCRKSTFIDMLMPKPLSDNYITAMNYDLKSVGSVRDAHRMACSHAFLEWGEVDRFLSDNISSTVKDFISSDIFTITDKYAISETKFKKHALLIGTTNSINLVLSRDGTRRTPIIPVQWIDTNKMMTLNLHHIYRDLRDNVFFPALKKSKTPWILTEKEIDAAASINKEHTAQSDVAHILTELFDTSIPFDENIPNPQLDKTGRTMTRTKIYNLISAHRKVFPNRSHLIRELHTFCGEYTGTTRRSKQCGKYLIHRGLITIGNKPNSIGVINKKPFWVMPPLAEQIEMI